MTLLKPLAPFLLISLLTVSGVSGANDAPNTAAPSPEIGLKRLQAGNLRFVAGKSTNEQRIISERRILAKSQSPFSAVLSCSDSRVPPEEVFDQGLGKVFVVRVAGNILTPEGIASLEYAVTHLNTTLIVIMGHSSCGAVKATLETPAGQSLGSPSLDILAEKIRPHLVAAATPDALDRSIEENVRATAKELKSASKIISDLVDSGKVKIVPAVYRLDTGKVQFFLERPSI